MLLVILATAVAIWCAYRVAEAGRGQIISEAPQLRAKIDPFADHPMHCKCPAHR